jgi:dTDP-4-amino-4,6-dideoxygalactose transaminase
MKIEFYRHNLNDEDKIEVRKVLDSLFLTTGEWTKQFEDKFAEYLGVPYVTGVSSCTNALEMALKYYTIGPGDQVITTPMSFIATANAIETSGAQPVFVDVEPETGNMDTERIEAAVTDHTKAIIPVHLYGQMCDMPELRRIADRYSLKIIEDAAHCTEGTRDGIRVGALGDISCFSFYATKSLTCGEGGAVVCHDADTNDWLRKARLHGMSKNAADRYSKIYEHYDMEFLGFKCNLNNIHAALLVNQIDRLDQICNARQQVAARFDEAFDGESGLKRPAILPDSFHPRHLYTLWVDPTRRDQYMHELQQSGIGVAVNFRSIHLMTYYRKKYGYRPGDFPNCEHIGNSTITLPLYPLLKDEEIEWIIKEVKRVLHK